MLGCEQSRVYVTARGGYPHLGELTQLTQVQWERRLDETSTAQVSVVAPSPACCELLGQIRTWGHELAIYRGGERAWEGPVTGLDIGAETALIDARDVSAWLDHRLVHDDLDHTGAAAADLAAIARAYVVDALAPDDPNVLPYLHVIPTGVVGERQTAALTAYAGDELRELLRTGVDMSVIGRRIVLGPESSFGHLPALGPGAFVGEVRVKEVGSLAATRAVVRGTGVVATCGGTDPFHGLLEVLVSEESILDVASARAAACSRVDAGSPPPLYVDAVNGAQLDPRAPMCINDLVPGATAVVSNGDTCRELAQTQRLTRVTVTDTPENPDVVRVSFAPVGTLTENTETP